MTTFRSIRSYLRANGFYLTIYQSGRAIWVKLHSWMLAREFGVRKLVVEPPFRLNGRRFISVGENFASGPGLWLEAVYKHNGKEFSPAIVIGANVSVSQNVHIGATTYVEIGSDVLIGSRVMITDHNHGTYTGTHPSNPSEPPSRRPLESGKRTVIGSRVWIGDGVVVTAGATIGEGAIIGSNSVVIGEIPPSSIAAGIPATVLKKFDEETRQWSKGTA